ncbi:MAG: LCP family protein, partial [Actinomycetota bacterium]|nr:LCP family protein [Actinomycetota bacterium]
VAGLALGGRVVAALLSLTVLVGSGYYWATFRQFTANVPRIGAIMNTDRPRQDIDGKDQNILIVGNDDRDTASAKELKALGLYRDGGSKNTDTMMLIHVPANGKRASVISFPRDTYVAIPGHGMDRLNAAYVDGLNASHGDHGAGARLLVQTLQNLTGFTVDHYVQIDLLGFARISNAIGGVRVCLNAAQNASTEGDASHPNGYSGINLKKGWNTIQGKQALAFVRQRHGLSGGDIDRIRRQQYFLSAVFRKMASAGTLLNPLKLQRLLGAVSSSLQMDGDSKGHQGLNPLVLARQIQDLSAGNISFSTIPTQSATVNGKDVLTVNPDAIRTFVAKAIGSTASSAYAKAKTVNPSAVSVTVLNGTGRSGVAGSNAAVLTQAGFKTSTGDAASTSATQIRYPGGMEDQAKTLALYVPGATVVQAAGVSAVTLVLGTDGDKAVSTPATKAATVPSVPKSSAAAGARTAAQADCIN